MRRLLCERCAKVKDVSEFSQRMVELADEFDADFAPACKECVEELKKGTVGVNSRESRMARGAYLGQTASKSETR